MSYDFIRIGRRFHHDLYIWLHNRFFYCLRNGHSESQDSLQDGPRWLQERQKDLKRGSIRGGFPIGNANNALKNRVCTVFFSKGHFQMILMTTLLVMTDDKRSRARVEKDGLWRFDSQGDCQYGTLRLSVWPSRPWIFAVGLKANSFENSGVIFSSKSVPVCMLVSRRNRYQYTYCSYTYDPWLPTR